MPPAFPAGTTVTFTCQLDNRKVVIVGTRVGVVSVSDPRPITKVRIDSLGLLMMVAPNIF